MISMRYILALLAVTLLCATASLLAIRFVAGAWADNNRHTISIIIGCIILAPWLVAMVRMRKPV
jgi:hypothetical protein